MRASVLFEQGKPLQTESWISSRRGREKSSSV